MPQTPRARCQQKPTLMTKDSPGCRVVWCMVCLSCCVVYDMRVALDGWRGVHVRVCLELQQLHTHMLFASPPVTTHTPLYLAAL